MKKIVLTLMTGIALTSAPTVAAAGSGGGVGVITPMTDSFWTGWRLIDSDRSWWDGHLFCRWQREYVQFSPQTGEYVVRQTQTTVTGGYPCPAP
ncbi:hypothetical protein [Deinococcus sp. 12RED42]|uniref:hypothetical protein n=1 Tax=Deinococcus sp. 12RED42 TaxID=2745872 RepID=UPI001E450478|nr:hypothetical protein [Deinococcus sp. 12RED42]MCD0166030.1 hypothetical protein [Deinococcus sp. 12RED42]